VQRHLEGRQLLVAVLLHADVAVVDDVGHGAVQIHVIGRVVVVIGVDLRLVGVRGEDRVDALQAIRLHFGDILGQRVVLLEVRRPRVVRRAVVLEEVGEEGVGVAVIVQLSIPVGELVLAVDRVVGRVTGGEAAEPIDLDGHVCHPLVHPCLLVRIVGELDHVVELVRQDRRVGVCRRVEQGRVHVEELALVGMAVHRRRVLVRRGVVAGDHGSAHVDCEVGDVDVDVVVRVVPGLTPDLFHLGGLSIG
jgi:hypothetical protein